MKEPWPTEIHPHYLALMQCKVSVGEPDFPIAFVTRGKKVIAGINQSPEVSDYDFSKISIIPDAV